MLATLLVVSLIQLAGSPKSSTGPAWASKSTGGPSASVSALERDVARYAVGA